ncbi:MAG: hypothetical protein U9O87_03875 [Verrucomicrobiota bacterium]|nr:hypothetical protein [Verrucomicrobiota bacterium]
MQFLDRLEQNFGKFAIQKLPLYLAVAQLVCFFYASAHGGIAFLNHLVLNSTAVMQGEIWRLFTFVIIPPGVQNLFALFGIYFVIYFMGSALVEEWGDFKFTFFVFSGWLMTVVASFFFPYNILTNVFLETSIILAFAYLLPNFEFYLFFVLPIKIKYLAYFIWAGLVISLVFAPWSQRICLLASLTNYFIFFGKDIYMNMKAGKRNMKQQVEQIKISKKAFHVCNECGVTDKDEPGKEFRISSQDGEEYCLEHLP